ncbi:unnamed protein product [Parnassius apollo]|uniref:(apollo) hypothetical protein n=1 Tax=Parnassius apollo TaxID=110799 RepID=A0A8S3XPJ4_PARAO|nr:unnamed protein product [Parnassius apollo]
MIIGNVAVATTNQLRKTLKRKFSKQQSAQKNQLERVEVSTNLQLISSSFSITDETDCDDFLVFEKPGTSQQEKTYQELYQ